MQVLTASLIHFAGTTVPFVTNQCGAACYVVSWVRYFRVMVAAQCSYRRPGTAMSVPCRRNEMVFRCYLCVFARRLLATVFQ